MLNAPTRTCDEMLAMSTILAPALTQEHDAPVTLAGFPTEEHFRAFYERTVQPLHGYLRRVLRDPSRADDLLQEAYLRMMRVALPADAGFPHRKNYLFRIATNLIHDHYRAAQRDAELPSDLAAAGRFDHEADLRRDVRSALDAVSARDRQLLWLAYVERFSHREIAELTELKEQSIRPMLLRARHRLASELRQRGVDHE